MKGTDFYKCKSTGHYRIRIAVPGKLRRSSISTGQLTLNGARRVVQETGIDRLRALAEAKAVTFEAIQTIVGARALTVGAVYEEFKEYLEATRSQSLNHQYNFALAHFICRLGVYSEPMFKIDERQICTWLHSESPALWVLQTRLNAIRKFYGFALAKGAISFDPTRIISINYRGLTAAQMRKLDPLPMTDDEYVLLLDHLTGFWRDWHVLSYCCGLRLSDCICLEWASFGENDITIFPLKSRGKYTPVRLPLDSHLIYRPELRELVERLLAMPNKDPRFVWPEQAFERLDKGHCYYSYTYVNQLKDAGVYKKSFHSLRRAFIIRLERQGMPIERIAKLAGHSNTAMTQHYLNSQYRLPPPSAPVQTEGMDYSELEMAALGGS
jgi:integrase